MKLRRADPVGPLRTCAAPPQQGQASQTSRHLVSNSPCSPAAAIGRKLLGAGVALEPCGHPLVGLAFGKGLWGQQRHQALGAVLLVALALSTARTPLPTLHAAPGWPSGSASWACRDASQGKSTSQGSNTGGERLMEFTVDLKSRINEDPVNHRPRGRMGRSQN